MGGLLLAFFAVEEGIFYGGPGIRLAVQLYGIVACAGWSASISYFLLKFVDMLLGLRVTMHDEEVGLDETQHGETLCIPISAPAGDQPERGRLEVQFT